MLSLLFRPKLTRALWRFHKALGSVSYAIPVTAEYYDELAKNTEALKRFEFDITASPSEPRPNTWENAMGEYDRWKDACRNEGRP